MWYCSPPLPTVVALEEVKTPSTSSVESTSTPPSAGGSEEISSEVLSPKAAALDRRLPTADVR
jgi:hypothetical protein